MKSEWTRLAKSWSIGLAVGVVASPAVFAQDQAGGASPSPQAGVPAAAGQQAEGSYPDTGHHQVAWPSAQSPAMPPPWLSHASISHLRNPFESGEPPFRRGLFGPSVAPMPSPQYPGMPGMPVPAMPGMAPGVPEMSGAPLPPGVAPEAGGMPQPGPPEAGLTTPAAPSTAATAGADALAAAAAGAGAGFGGGLSSGSDAFPMLGDQGPGFLRQAVRFPPIPPPLPPGVPRPGDNPGAALGRSVAAIVPAVRAIKIADNQYPRPVDRVWFNFNYYDGVNSGINDILNAPIKNMQVYREIFGIEKTFLDQQASIGFRLPLNTLTVTSNFPGLGGTHTSTGNFSSFVKYALYDDGANFFSVGLDLNFPTGPRTFAGFPTILGINPFEMQPFFGYIFQRDRVYVQGFNSISVPMDRRVATMYYCDIGVGYFVYRSRDPGALLSFLVPSFETHLNIPLNWAGLQPQYIGSTPHVVDLTFALNAGLGNRAVLSAAYVRPVTGPLPFSGEFALMLNIPFGGRPGRAFPLTPPPTIGQ